jgi:hypothetical protein
MQYTLTLDGTPDIAAIEHLIAALDPAAIVDLEARTSQLRISSLATDAELIACLHQAGIAIATDALIRLPSQCCGGCGG